MRGATLTIIVGALLLVQVSFLAALRPLGVVPDLALVAVILVGLSQTVSRALIVGLVGGLLLDVVSGADFGLRTGLFLLAALATGLVRRAGLTLGGPLAAVALVTLATLVQTLVILVNLWSSTTQWPVALILRTLGAQLLLNVVLTLLLRPIFLRLAPREAALPSVE